MIQLEPKQDVHEPKTRKLNFKLYLALLGSLLVLFGVLYTFTHRLVSHWTRERLERVLSEGMSRKVELGKIHWGLGIFGVVFDTNALLVSEKDGKPFMRSDHCKVTIPLWTDRQGDVFPGHIDVERPEVWAVKLSPNEWNFSDLPKMPALRNLTHFEISGGVVHVRDDSKSDGKSHHEIDLKEIHCKVEKPFLNRTWPFSLSTVIPRNGYTTKLDIRGEGTGKLDDWAVNTHKFSLRAESLNLPDLNAYLGKLPDIVGPIDIDLAGKGVPEKGFSGKGKLKTPQYEVSVENIDFEGSLTRLGGLANKSKEQGKSKTETLTDIVNGFNATINMRNGALSVSGKATKLSKLNGTVKLERSLVNLQKVSGNFGDSPFNLNGEVKSNGEADLAYHGTNIDIEKVKAALKDLRIEAPPVVNKPFFGKAREASLTLKGKLGAPVVSLTASPQNIYYLDGKNKVFEATGGQVEYKNSICTFKKLTGLLGKAPFEIDGTCGTTENDRLAIKFSAQHPDLEDVKRLVALGNAHGTFAKQLDQIFGQARRATGTLEGTLKAPKLALKAEPQDFYYLSSSHQKMLQLNGGEISIEGANLGFKDVRGTLGSGKFDLNGEATGDGNTPLSIKLKATNIDLANVKLAMQALNIHSPLLAEQLLYGTVNDVRLDIDGKPEKPTIDMTCTPQDIMYEPFGSSKIVHIKGGKVTYKDDCLQLANIDVDSQRSHLHTTMIVEHLSDNSRLTELKVHTQQLGLLDLDSYIMAPRTPKEIQSQYTKLLTECQVQKPRGRIAGDFELKMQPNGTYGLLGNATLKNLGGTIAGYPIQNVNGAVSSTLKDFTLQNISGAYQNSTFTVSGDISSYSDPTNRHWKLNVISGADLNGLVNAMQLKKNAAVDVVSSQPLGVQLSVAGPDSDIAGTYSLTINPNSEFSLNSAVGLIQKPAGKGVKMSGNIHLKNETMYLENTTLDIAGRTAHLNGSIKPVSPSPVVALHLSLPQSTQLNELITLLPDKSKDSSLKDVGGQMGADIDIRGAINVPDIKGNIKLTNISIPAYKVSNAFGELDMADWVSTAGDNNQNEGGIYAPLKVKMKSFNLNNLEVTNIQGQLVAQASKAGERMEFQNMSASLAGGHVDANGSLEPNKPAIVTMHITGVDANQLSTKLLGISNEVSGTLRARAEISASLQKGKSLVDSLGGTGMFLIEKGRVTRFSLLQRRINQADLLKGGFLNFNLNNLLESVAPVQEGNFQTFKGFFKLDQGKLRIPFVEFSGEELRLRIAGLVNFDKNAMHFDVAGLLPRNTETGGFEASKLSLRDMMLFVDQFPIIDKRLPIPQRPRAFAFKVSGNPTKPDSVTSSIYHSFHWLANKRFATPYPALVGSDTSVSVDAGAISK